MSTAEQLVAIPAPARTLAGEYRLFRDRDRLRSVCADGQRLGPIVDVLLDRDVQRVVGFAATLDAVGTRVAPLAIVNGVGPCGVEVDAAIQLLDCDLYAETTVPLSSLRGQPVRCAHRGIGWVDDVVADLSTGAVIGLELGSGCVVETLDAVADDGGFVVACECGATVRQALAAAS